MEVPETIYQQPNEKATELLNKIRSILYSSNLQSRGMTEYKIAQLIIDEIENRENEIAYLLTTYNERAVIQANESWDEVRNELIVHKYFNK